MDKTEMLSKLNRFTRRELSEDEVYIFDVILCDNDIDRDCERFSLNALKQLQRLFVGKTGIFDHDPKSSGQTARIFHTELLSDTSRLTAAGEPYTCLKGCAYMVRSDGNSQLILEIDGGIKKEVSVSCSASAKKCSVCGTDLSAARCSHVPGKNYSGKTAHVILDDITDAYEWSFVAVPAQVNAGVTKKYNSPESLNSENAMLVDKLCKGLKADIYRLCLAGPADVYSKAVEKMSVAELLEFKEHLEKNHRGGGVSQLGTDCAQLDQFRLEVR